MTNTNIDYWEKILQNPTISFKQLFEEEKKYLTSHININSHVLDVGCGDGTTIQTILPITENISGIDNDLKAIEDAKTKLSSIPNIKIIAADALALPFNDRVFDVVINMMTLVNFNQNKTKALQEMSRVLKDDGKIIISVYSEKAFNERIEMYKIVKAPIDKINGTTVILDRSLGANVSEQFSKNEIEYLANQASLSISNYQEVGTLAYILELKKKLGTL